LYCIPPIWIYTAAYAYYGDKLGAAFADPKATATLADAPKEPITSALDPNAFVDFKLKSVQKLTPNTSRFTFELGQGQNLGLDVASCVVTKFASEDGKPVIRPYTPTSAADRTGSFDFVIKHYEGTFCVHTVYLISYWRNTGNHLSGLAFL